MRGDYRGTAGLMATHSFIEQHGLWTDEQRRAAEDIKLRVERDKLKLIRLAWADPHGASRAKAVTPPAFVAALNAGYNINVATTTLDSANARTFSSFTRGGGMGLAEMTGSPNLTIVPDPATFRVLPWAPGVGWILCDEYFNTGVPFHFSPRHLLRRQLRRLADRRMGYVVGLEVEWYLLRVVQDQLTEDNIGAPGTRGQPLKTTPPEPGYSYHSESNMDLMQPVLSALTEAFEAIDLPLRSVENEWGPGQVECTFAAGDALTTADNLLLFRTATRQICRRLGHSATFMCRPRLKGYYSSGWHLHQSLIDAVSGQNLLMPDRAADVLSLLGRHFTGGLLQQAAPATAFTTPTVNGYRRFRPNSLAPDRATWCYDHRGVMIRALGGPGDPATRLENRVGEPAANPYLFMASQIVAGLDGADNALDPGPQSDEPYTSDRPLLPNSLPAALDALEQSPLFRREFGDVFIDYFLKLKRNEAGRFRQWLAEAGVEDTGDETTEWEQREYFDFF
ncbi:MAG: glutamine synthetase [Alphaproteobacteria bacterium]|jgi:glutamine synthetase|nr:glutamine synthetase [Alphaproteobacteria bacterium]